MFDEMSTNFEKIPPRGQMKSYAPRRLRTGRKRTGRKPAGEGRHSQPAAAAERRSPAAAALVERFDIEPFPDFSAK